MMDVLENIITDVVVEMEVNVCPIGILALQTGHASNTNMLVQQLNILNVL
jgi:tartrate dehydratase alpha subunit/fumarate hydratase class I-like protein